VSEDRFIRYYIGGNVTINKLYFGGDIQSLPTKDNPVTVLQTIRKDVLPENLDKEFYIKECKEIIEKILQNKS
nr:hypothetical protein [Bacteroidales bacterium]